MEKIMPDGEQPIKAKLEAQLTGPGAIAQGNGAQAVGAGGVLVDRNVVNGNIIVGDNNQVVIHQGKEVVIPSAEAVARHRIALKERLEKEAITRWGGMSFYIQEEGVTLPIEASPYQTGQLGARTNLQASLKSAQRMLLLGDPGSGKTIALERLAWELCAEDEPVMPVLVRLFRYDGKPLAEWVRTRLQECGCLRLDDEHTLTVFLQEGATRCVFLFDGLNEVAPEYRTALVGELDRWMSAYPRHAVIVTSRVQDELWRGLRGELPAMLVQPIDAEQARAYLTAHLGAKGDELYQRLDERLLALARTPLILWLIKEAGMAGESLPGNRGELYARFVGRMLRRDTERQMDVQFPERIKQGALAALALRMSRAQRLTCPRREAVDVAAGVFAKDAPEKLEKAEALVNACARHGLLAGEDELWFAPHQTVQEHFAALALQETVRQEQGLSGAARLWRNARQTLPGQKTGLAALAAADWWMETFVQLAGLVADPDWLAREVARANPWLAWWCLEEGRAVDEKTRAQIEKGSMGLLRSSQAADRRRAVQTLAQIKSKRGLPTLWAVLRDEADPEIAQLALQALSEQGEAARQMVEKALYGKDRREWRAAVRYLGIRPDEALIQQIPWDEILGQPMVWISPGPFVMGSDKGRDPKAHDAELPQHELTLPGYWIGRTQVTVAQWCSFVNESGHKADASSLKDPDDHPVRYVNWHDAMAYCRWWSEKTDLALSLPSEAEWEKAASWDAGADGRLPGKRIYPWGNEFDSQKCNTSESGIGTTTPVGKYSPQGDSPYGCADMAGNVWEWTRSKFKPYPYKADDGCESLEGGEARVLRGGSWSRPQDGACAAYRSPDDPHDRGSVGGFRLVVRPPSLLNR
jgi:formylglycine-generating enzyme required for sulfatase activity